MTQPLRSPDFGEETAREELILVAPDGSHYEVRARLGRPYRAGEQEWACPCELAGFEPRYADARGTSSLQALALALMLLRIRLQALLEEGFQLRPPEAKEEAFSRPAVDALFGVLPPAG